MLEYITILGDDYVAKFYEELKSNLYLPVKSDRPFMLMGKMEHYFYTKYNSLFELIDRLRLRFNCNVLTLVNDIYHQDSRLYSKLLFNLKYLYDLGFDYRNMYLQDLETFLLIWGESFDLMFEMGIFSCDRYEYLNYMGLFNNAVNDVLLAERKIIKVKLPNAWLVSSRDCLFNAFSKKHLDADFSDIYEKYNKLFYSNGLDFQGGDNSFVINDMLKGINEGYVNPSQIEKLTKNGEYVSFNGKVFDSKYLTLVRGALELEKDYYSFLKKIFMYTDEPFKQLDKIRHIKGDNYDDVLVSCCGVAKVNSGSARSVVTGSFDYKKEFEEYAYRGYTVSFLPPFRLNYEKKCVDEYSDEFLLLKSLR